MCHRTCIIYHLKLSLFLMQKDISYFSNIFKKELLISIFLMYFLVQYFNENYVQNYDKKLLRNINYTQKYNVLRLFPTT